MSKKTEHVDDLDDPKYDPPAEVEQEPEKREPKPGDADYDWSPHYDTDDLYFHTFPDGQVIALRSFASIYSKTWLYKLRKAQTDTDIQFAAIDRAASITAQAVLESVEAPLDGPDPIDSLWEAWSKAGTSHVDGEEGLSTGESRG